MGVTMKQVTNFNELVDGNYYSYGGKAVKTQVFKLELVENWEREELSFLDGYVSNPPTENLKRHINEGKVYHIPEWKVREL